MNRFFKKLAAGIMSAAMCLSLCACDTDLDTLLLMKKVSDAVSDTKSFEGEFECTAKAKYGFVPLKVKVDGDILCILEKPQLEVDAEIDLGILGDTDVKLYAAAGEKTADVYVGIEDLTGKMSWIHESVDIPEGKSLDMKGMLDLIDKGSDLLTKGEEKQINGVKCVKITLTLPGDMIGVALGNESDTVKDLVIDAWVNKSTGQIIRIDTELGDIAKAALTVFGGDMLSGVEFTELPLHVEINSFNTVKEIKIPNEALTAEGYEHAA